MEKKALGIKHDLLDIKQELPLKRHSFINLYNKLKKHSHFRNQVYESR